MVQHAIHQAGLASDDVACRQQRGDMLIWGGAADYLGLHGQIADGFRLR